MIRKQNKADPMQQSRRNKTLSPLIWIDVLSLTVHFFYPKVCSFFTENIHTQNAFHSLNN